MSNQWRIEIRDNNHKTIKTLLVSKLDKPESDRELWERCPEIVQAIMEAQQTTPGAYVARVDNQYPTK